MKVLVAMDSSDLAGEILDEVASRTWPSGSEFQVITAIETGPNWEAGKEFLNQGRVILNDRIESLVRRLPKSLVTGQILEGSATTAITKMAQEWGADLIVIGSHGDTGARKPENGSVAAAVVNKAPCSVEVVKLSRKCGGHYRTAVL